MFVIEQSPEIAYRTEFSRLCNERGLLAYAVEVGTDLGEFAADFLLGWNGHQLLLVDDYAPYPERPWDRSGDMMTAVVRLSLTCPGRFRFVRSRSPGVASQLPDWMEIGFVYVDGAHDFDDVRADVEAWWGRLSPTGILAGHDYDGTHGGVMAAVRDFALGRNLPVRLTRDELPSWYVYKTEPERLVRRLSDVGEMPNPRFGQ